MMTEENWVEEFIRLAPPDVIAFFDSIVEQVRAQQERQFTEQGVSGESANDKIRTTKYSSGYECMEVPPETVKASLKTTVEHVVEQQWKEER